MREHDLKCLPEYFQAVWEGRKPFEVRYDDRSYDVGDRLCLREWASLRGYSGRAIMAEVTYKMHGGRYGLNEHFCVLGINVLERSGELP